MRHLSKRLTALEQRNDMAGAHLFFLPFDLSEAEEISWHEEHISPTALAATGISPNAKIMVVKWFGSVDDTPPARRCPW
jgi:hypothetical protein